MNRRLIAGVLLAALAILGGLDLFEDTGWIQYSTTEMDKTVEDTLDNYGEAIRSANHDSIASINTNPHILSQDRHALQEPRHGSPIQLARHKRNLDVLKSACVPLDYTQVFLA